MVKIRGLLIVSLCLLLLGCSSGDPVGDVVPVKGRVFVGDKPLNTGVVIFHPHAQRNNTTPHEPRGRIDADGNYELITANKPGAPRGWYKVAIVAQKLANDKVHGHAPIIWLIDSKYANHDSSGLEVEVVEKAAADAYKFTIK